MNFSALKDEFAARGVDYLSDTRRGQYINWARADLDAMFPWPYRKTSASGTAGAGTVTATDLGSVRLVADTNRTPFTPLDPWNDIDLVRECGSLTLTGVPWAWYSPTPGTVTAYPLGGTLLVYYYMTTPDLSGPTDTPVAPSKYHGLIVDMAIQMAYRDSDDHTEAEKLQLWIDRQAQRMADDLFSDQPPGAPIGMSSSVDC